jgi:cardiolipin synthase
MATTTSPRRAPPKAVLAETARAALHAVYKRYPNDPEIDLVLGLARRGLADFLGQADRAGRPRPPTILQAFGAKSRRAGRSFVRSGPAPGRTTSARGPLDFSSYDAQTRDLLLLYLNYLPSSGLELRTRDDPMTTTGRGVRQDYAIGGRVARAIARVRAEQGGMFTTLEQLDLVPGFGPDKLRDVAYTAGQLDPAAFGMAAPRAVAGNRVTAVVDGPDLRQTMLDLIARAEHYIHLQVMLFFSDRWGMEIADALAAKAKAGVQVRVMADGDVTASGYLGSVAVDASGKADFARVRRRVEESGGRTIDTRKEDLGTSAWRKLREQLRRQGVPEEFLVMQDQVQRGVEFNWNATDHRKFMVVDGVTSMVGSFNIGPNYLYDDAMVSGIPANRGQWHDGFLVLEGPISSELNRLFAGGWVVRGGDLFDHTEHFRQNGRDYGTDVCTVLLSFPGNPQNVIQSRFLELIRYSVGETIIENPYVIDRGFWELLGRLDAKRAERTVLINPFSSEDGDFPFRVASIKCNMWRPHEKGVRVYDYARGRRSSHYKIFLDTGTDTVLHGSYNINNRSAEHDFELCVLVHSKTLAGQVGGILRHDKEVSRRVEQQSEHFRNPNAHLPCWTMKCGYEFA